jgi:hypothetical protein
MTDEERIVAYVDGELDAEARARLEADAGADPALARAIARHRALRETVGGAWADVLEEPVPERLRAAVVRGRASGGEGRRPAPRAILAHLPQWAAMAACVAVGVFLGRGVTERGPLAAASDGTLVARGALAAALSRQTAGQGGVAPIKIGLSFRTADQRYCRTFASPGDRLAGVACRDGDRWAARMTTAYQASIGGAPEYRTAASETPPAVLAAVDSLIVGEPLDAAGEAAAKARGWRD